MSQQKAHTGGTGLFIIMSLVYIGLLILFGWQTWEFVDWLFPSDQVLMKILTLVCFDVMALLWASLDLFYRFAVKGARSLVRWAWGISFVLSLLASIFYLVIRSMFRFNLVLAQTQVNIGYGVVIVAVTFQVVMITFFLYLEWNARHPYQDEYEVRTAPRHPLPSRPPVSTVRTRRPVQRVRVAQVTEAPRRVKQLPPVQVEEKSEEEESEEEEYTSDEEPEEEEENVPLSERLTNARNALLPKSGRKSRRRK